MRKTDGNGFDVTFVFGRRLDPLKADYNPGPRFTVEEIEAEMTREQLQTKQDLAAMGAPFSEMEPENLGEGPRITTGTITETYERETNVLYEVVYENGGKLGVTGDHPFMIKGKGWISVARLQPGDISLTKSGSGIRIMSVSRKELDEPVKVYNVKVDPYANYFVGVGDEAILVHNGDYRHSKDRRIYYERLNPGEAGRTEVDFDWEYEVFRKPDGTYGVRIKIFEVSSRVLLNPGEDWNHISEFGKYYREDGIYSIRDVNPRFATKAGTIFHERLHQQQVDDELQEAESFIEKKRVALLSSAI